MRRELLRSPAFGRDLRNWLKHHSDHRRDFLRLGPPFRPILDYNSVGFRGIRADVCPPRLPMKWLLAGCGQSSLATQKQLDTNDTGRYDACRFEIKPFSQFRRRA